MKKIFGLFLKWYQALSREDQIGCFVGFIVFLAFAASVSLLVQSLVAVILGLILGAVVGVVVGFVASVVSSTLGS
jgi:tetrahydromethanopterin S-methyltransferase subunit C